MTMKLTVDIWSDIACPWCYVGKRRFEAALRQFGHRDAVRVVWRAFELKPDAPPVESSRTSYVERLATKYRTTTSDAQAMIDRMTGVAAQDGLTFRFDRIQPGNTFLAHRLLHLAAQHQLQDTLKERLLRAYLTEGAAIGDRATLKGLAEEAGLPAEEVDELMETDRFASEVRDDETEAHELGITGVPFFVFAKRYAVSGAQSADVLLSVLERAWTELVVPEAVTQGAYSEGAVCGPDGCG